MICFYIYWILIINQPALLYLSPACILSTVFTALIRGEWKEVWGFELNPETKEESKKEEIEEPVKKKAAKKEKEEEAEAPKSERATRRRKSVAKAD